MRRQARVRRLTRRKE